MIYLLRDDFFGERRLAALRAALGPPDVQGLNNTSLDGARISLGDLRAAADAMPFLSERRLVVTRRLFSSRRSTEAEGQEVSRRGKADAAREKEFLAYLAEVPRTTDLVILEDPTFSPDHAAAKAVQKLGGQVVLEGLPRGEALVQWIEKQVREKGGRIDRGGIDALVTASITDARILDQSLDKLVAYADGERITAQAVRLLVAESREASVFDLVDAVGQRDRHAALAAYRSLLAEDVSPIYILVMLTRQIRLLLLAWEAREQREDLAATLKLHPRVAMKIGQQSRHFSAERCVAAYAKLAETDQAIKTGQATEEVAVELLLVELTSL